MKRAPRGLYTAAEARWLKANLATIVGTLDAYQRALDAYFERTRTSAAVAPLTAQQQPRRRSGRVGKGHWIIYSDAELAFIKRRRRLPRRELHARFIAAFPRRDVNLDAIKALCSRKGWHTGRDGCFPKGFVPANKGKKMPFNANSARTQFKKGNRTGRANVVYKPIGTERLSKDGYIERKINDDMPFQRRWRAVHILNWEAVNGSIPTGHCLKSLDGNKANTDPSNWELMPRAMLPRLNGKSGRAYDQAPDDLKPTIMAVAKLEHRLREMTRSEEKEAA
jgi:hypothetical protein